MRKILIAEDDQANRALLHKILDEEYEIIEAANGKEALEILQKKHRIISAVLLDITMPLMDGFELLRTMRSNAVLSQIPVIVATGDHDESSEVMALSLGANDYVTKPYNSALILHCLRNTINLRETASIINAIQRDKLTGLYNREAFFEKVSALIAERESGYYIMSCFDIDNFKLINDQYGAEEGDCILRHIGKASKSFISSLGGICSRISADNFAMLYHAGEEELEQIKKMKELLTPKNCRAPISFSVGRYIINDLSLSASTIYDRAFIAKRSVKGRYDRHIAYFDDSMLEKLIREQQIIGEMDSALQLRQFEVWYQPQYNHATGALIGSEALVRWRHPSRGLISPTEFIPVFEQNGFVYEMDKYVWEQICANLRRWLDEGNDTLPVSANISRYDVFRADLVDVICSLVEKYDIPIELLHLEITESAFAKSSEQIINVVMQLIARGFTVEIDDFGSGYSSLNTLKDVPANVLKLDMHFLDSNRNSRRGGNILESIVRMAKWLNMTVIAEGVETIKQADFLKSIGCCYMQGFLYAQPMPVEQYEELFRSARKEARPAAIETVDNLDSNAFWDPRSMDTLVFNSYIGGACIFEYHQGEIELLRANDRYAQTIGIPDVSVEDALKLNWNRHLDKQNLDLVADALELSHSSGNEISVDIEALDLPGCRHRTYLHTTFRVIASSNERYLVYCMNENTTAQREAEERERIASEQVQTVLNDVGSGITAAVLQDGKMQFLIKNDKYLEIIGYTREQFDAEVSDVYKLIYPDDMQSAAHISADAYFSRRPTQFDFRIIRRDGELRWTRAILTLTQLSGVDQPVQLCVLSDVTAQKNAESALKATDENLRFLNETAHELLAHPDSDRSIENVLGKLLSYFGGARAYIFEMCADGQSISNSYEVCAQGVTHEKENLKNLPVSYLSFWLSDFESKGFVSIPELEALGEDRVKEKALLRSQNINSLLAVPLRRDGRMIGFIGVDDPSKQTSHIERLAAIGDYIAVMLTRRDLDAKIISDNQTLLAVMNDTPGGFVRMRVLPSGVSVPVYFNEGFCKMCGMSLEELMAMYGSDSLAGVHPDDLEIVRGTVQRMLRDGKAESARYRLLHGSGGYIWVSIFARVTKGESGELFFNVYYTDVSDAQPAASKSESTLPAGEYNARFQLISDNIPGGLATYRCTPGRIELIYFNNGFLRLTGYTREEYAALAGKYPHSLVFERDIPAIMKLADTLVEGTSAAEYVFRIHTKDGGYKWLSGKAAVASRSENAVIVNILVLDISELRESMELLRISEEEHRLATEHSGNLICRYDIRKREISMSDESAALRGMPTRKGDMPEIMIREGLIEPCTEKDYLDFFERIHRGEKTGTATFQYLLHDQWRYLRSHFSTVFSEDGVPVSAVVSFHDVTEQLEKESIYKKWQQSLQDRDPSSYTLFRSNLSKNSFFETIEGTLISPEGENASFSEYIKHYAQCCVFEDDREGYIALMDADALLAGFYRGKRSYVTEYRETSNGEPRWIRLSIDLVEYPDSEDVEAYLMYEDIDEAKHAELLSLERAEKDALTGVLNRSAFISKMEEIISSSGRDTKHALMMLDIDGFKLVNDVFGHQVGDQALVDVANTTRSALRRGDLLGRLGGDEFLIFLSDIPNDAVALNIAKRICSMIKKAFSLEVQISGSIGIVVCPRDGMDFETLYKKVDAAMYFVKGSGKNNYAFYHEEMENEHLSIDESEDKDQPHEAYFVKKEKKRRMLIVDDNQMDHEFLSNVFKSEFIIEKAKDGASALTRLRHYGTAISVVLLDLVMPGMNGFAVLEKMRSSPEMKSVPVIVVSSSNDRETSLRAIRLGASDFVTKPVDPDLLRIRVQSAVSKGENERLRAQNSYLETESNELEKYRIVLERTGTVLIDHDWLRGGFKYDPCISEFIDGIWDARKLWHILLSDMVAEVSVVKSMQQFVHDLAEDRTRTEDSMSVELKTPAKVKHVFLMRAYKIVNDYQLTERIIITFNDTSV